MQRIIDTDQRSLYCAVSQPRVRQLVTHTEIIRQWPTLTAFAADVCEERECVRAWRDRNSIPARAYQRVVDAAAARGFVGVTYAVLAEEAAKSKVRRLKEKQAA